MYFRGGLRPKAGGWKVKRTPIERLGKTDLRAEHTQTSSNTISQCCPVKACG
jgi:hypothetical protein